jgi:hypothetical protein
MSVFVPDTDGSLDTLLSDDHAYDDTDHETREEALGLARVLHKAGPGVCCVARSLLGLSGEKLEAVQKFISGLTDSTLPRTTPVTLKGTSFPAGNDDFRAARDHAALACRRFNAVPDTAPPHQRVTAWLE